MPVNDPLIRRHGWSELAAATVAVMGNTLRVLTESDCGPDPRNCREWAALVDAQDGQLLGEAIPGRGSLIDVGVFLRTIDPTRRYVLIHTHPNNSSISMQDADVLLAHQPLVTVVVVGLDGTWFLLSKGGRPASREGVARSYDAERRRLRPIYLARQSTEGLSADEIWRLGSHEIWANIADRLDLVYDRLGPEEGRVT